jgi:hypothetical protein
MSVKSEVLEIVQELPGVIGKQIVELMSHANRGTIYAELNNLIATGQIVAEPVEKPDWKWGDGPRRVRAYRINPNPTPVAPPRKLKAPTETGLAAQLEDLKARIRELEEWQADALERHPDLAVKPIVLRAREIVAAVFKDDPTKAQQAHRGGMDTTPIMRATLTALEE